MHAFNQLHTAWHTDDSVLQAYWAACGDGKASSHAVNQLLNSTLATPIGRDAPHFFGIPTTLQEKSSLCKFTTSSGLSSTGTVLNKPLAPRNFVVSSQRSYKSCTRNSNVTAIIFSSRAVQPS
eukprot:1036879-Pyramimonas_sp.AAC.1